MIEPLVCRHCLKTLSDNEIAGGLCARCGQRVPQQDHEELTIYNSPWARQAMADSLGAYLSIRDRAMEGEEL